MTDYRQSLRSTSAGALVARSAACVPTPPASKPTSCGGDVRCQPDASARDGRARTPIDWRRMQSRATPPADVFNLGVLGVAQALGLSAMSLMIFIGGLVASTSLRCRCWPR